MRSQQGKAPRPASELLWFSVQITALVSAFVVPFLSSETKDQVGTEETSVRVRAPEPVGQVSAIPVTITSQVLKLPAPHEGVHAGKKLYLKSKHKQVRLQREANLMKTQNVDRSPASSGQATIGDRHLWHLVSVEKYPSDAQGSHGSSTEKVPLVYSAGRQGAIGTVFVELLPGNNLFDVTYADKKGRLEKVAVVIEYVPF